MTEPKDVILEEEEDRKRLRPQPFKSNDCINDRFYLKNCIGKGGFSDVYHAIDNITMEPIALKVVHENLKRIVTRERRVLKILQRHEHPHIIRLLLDTSTLDPRGDTVFILCYPLMKQSLLDEILTARRARGGTGGLDLNLLEPSIRDIVSGMAFLEEQHVVHMDLKPENILRSHGPNGRLVLADFGSSTPNIDHDVKFEAQTPWYRAPEVCLPADYGFEVDLWSLGCIVYEMECGRALFKSDSSAHLTYLHYRDIGPPPVSFLEMASEQAPPKYLSLNLETQQVSCLVRPWAKIPRSPRPHLTTVHGYRTSQLLQSLLRWMPQDRVTARELMTWPRLCYSDAEGDPPPGPSPPALSSEAKAVQEGGGKK